MNRARKDWGDPGDYANRMFAKSKLKQPNRAICLYCYRQALQESDIRHEAECPGLRAPEWLRWISAEAK